MRAHICHFEMLPERAKTGKAGLTDRRSDPERWDRVAVNDLLVLVEKLGTVDAKIEGQIVIQ